MPTSIDIDTRRVPALVELLDSLAFAAVEHADALDLGHFTALLDLYARHLEAAAYDGRSTHVTFEAFASDERLLALAAAAAERESGVPTRAPAPLGGGAAGSSLGGIAASVSSAAPEPREPLRHGFHVA